MLRPSFVPSITLFLLLGTVAVVNGCSSGASSSSDDSDLINGDIAPDDAFPATMQIERNCTVTRVGEDLILTAAHCVRMENASIRSEFLPGKIIAVNVRAASPARRELTITKTTLHPQIEWLCATRGCYGRASDERRDAPDVAVIQVQGGLEGVAIAEIDVEPMAPTEEVTILGYGCIGNVWGSSDGKLRFRNTRVVPVEASIHSGGLSSDDVPGLENIRTNYVVTPGPKAPSNSTTSAGADGGAADSGTPEGGTPEAVELAGLCPGDSGGALYRKGTNRVVGVNASYTFFPSGDVPVTNWHARVDGEARWGTAAWLASLGARLSARCTDETCKPARAAASLDGGAPDAGSLEGGAPEAGTDAGTPRDAGRD